MAKYGFDLQRKNKKRKTTALICLFIAFVILLGSVSTFLLWRSLNYDFNNFFVKMDEESTTSPPTTVKFDSIVYEGKAVFLVVVTSDDGKQVRFMNLVDVNLGEKTIRVIPFDHTKKNKQKKTTYEKLLLNKGVKEFISLVEEDLNINIDRYTLFTDTGYKSVFRALGDVTIKVNKDVEYDTPDMFLELRRGENVLAPEKAFKYMKYICETEEGYECSRLNADVIVSSFEEFYLINYCTLPT